MKKFWFYTHWFLGITVGLVIMVIGFTGAMLSYEQELLKFFNKDSYRVEVKEEKIPLEELLKHFSEKMPKEVIVSVTQSSKADDVVGITTQSGARKRGDVYHMDPYSGEILPLVQGKAFFMFNENLHRRLTFGKTGQMIVGISSIILLLLIFSGIYLYWSKIKRGFWKSFTFKTKTKGRAFMYGLHCSVGMWVSLFYVWMTLTGLYWSFDWYRSGVYMLLGLEQPAPRVRAERQAPKPKSADEILQGYLGVEKAFALLDENAPKGYSRASVSIPTRGSQYTLSYLDMDNTHKRETNSLRVDIKNSSIISHERYQDRALNEQLIRSMLPLHSGEYFGWIGVLVMFLSSILMPLFTITGIMLYIERFRREKANRLKKAAKQG